MGCLLSKPHVPKALIIGNGQHSGQTTFLNRLAFGMVTTTIPTIGFNVETINYYPTLLKPDFQYNEIAQEVEKRDKILMDGKPQFELTLWDIAAKPEFRVLWSNFYGECDTILFCVDSTKVDQLDASLIQNTLNELTSSSFMKYLCNSSPRVKKFGILCTKCDEPGAASVATIQRELMAKADRIKSICTTSEIDLRLFAVSSTDNFPTKRIEELTAELDTKIKQFNDGKDADGAKKLRNEKNVLSKYCDASTCFTWGTGQVDIINWIVTGVAPTGTSLLTDFNQTNPLSNV